MPKLTATDGLASASDIKRTSITPEDITKMSDEELHSYLAALRRDRETTAPRATRTGTTRQPRDNASYETIDESDDGVDI